ncbi:FAD-dependent monooxygenase [Aestuariibacter sp. AA17]|uniref:FAD-dependent monooxygenase n=1 Tax=Fluctibacter corallii TaxID=2984329 RepID=A0ABT3A4C6_9ALTE|nr:FAD-dependent monooxygenase [Aestuariibacter sp. AA17]MCV2883453.1 FAD-dependent monooxygenase [Aestuariibacter sp. AA17]
MKGFDVVVVGGGMVGLACALAMKDSQLNIAVIESNDAPNQLSDSPGLRVSALNLASRTLLQNLGVWEEIEQSRLQPYQSMYVWEQDSFAHIEFDQHTAGQPQLGYIIENQVITQALWAKVRRTDHIQVFTNAKINQFMQGQQETFIALDDQTMLSARLVVGADGANSFVRQQAKLPITFWDYEQSSIVATVKTALPHQNCARQVFTPNGPLAFLPLYEDNLCSIVWSQRTEQAKTLMALSDNDFSKALTAAFDAKLGLCEVHSVDQTSRQMFPLKMRYARRWLSQRVALVGDAAHTIHPLAGQGVNLGFMDAAALAETVVALHEQGKDIGDEALLRSYERWRKAEAAKMIAAMEGFKRLFDGANPLKKLVRDIGLTVVDAMPFAKEHIVQQAMGLTGDLPQMAKLAK